MSARHLKPKFQGLHIGSRQGVERLHERLRPFHSFSSVLHHGLDAVHHVCRAVPVPEPEVGREGGVGELVQAVLLRLSHEGGDHVVPEDQVHGLVALLALLQGQAGVCEEFGHLGVSLQRESLELGGCVWGVLQGVRHTPVAIQAKVELRFRL